MLIIAQPRSASSSLVKSLSGLLGIESTNLWKDGNMNELLRREKNKYPSFKHLPHSDIFEYTRGEIFQLIETKKIYKHYLIPIDSHVDILKESKEKFVVLVRDPAIQTYESYRRKLRDGMRDHYNIVRNKSHVIYELELFNKKYHEHFENYDKCLFIEFHDLIADQSHHINKIFDFFGMTKRVGFDYKLPWMK